MRVFPLLLQQLEVAVLKEVLEPLDGHDLFCEDLVLLIIRGQRTQVVLIHPEILFVAECCLLSPEQGALPLRLHLVVFKVVEVEAPCVVLSYSPPVLVQD